MTPKQWIVVAIILLFNLILRLHNYAEYPQRGATSDEYSYSFQGVSLLTTGVPTSWSAFVEYGPKKDLTIRGIYFPIVSPYFDHTPLNGIVVGAWSLLFGQNTFESIELRTIRLMPIFFSFISSLLIFLIARNIYDFSTAVWALIVYSVGTLFVMNGRVVLAENLISPLFLSAVYIWLRVKNRLSIRHAVILGIISSLVFWTKELGIAAAGTVGLFILETKKHSRLFLAFVATVCLGVLLYIFYGVHFDAELFWSILRVQSGRDIGPETFRYILSTPIIINKVYYDGWYFLGFAALAWCLSDIQKHKYIVIPSFVYLVLLLSSLTQRGEMGWYLIPLFPFMAIATARLMEVSKREHQWLSFLPVLLVGQYLISYFFMAQFGLTQMQYRVLLGVLIIPLICSLTLLQRSYSEKLISAYYGLFIVITMYLTYTYAHPA